MTGVEPLNPHDFYNPFMAAALVNEQGKRVPLWSTLGDGLAFDSAAGRALYTEGDKGKSLSSLAYLQELQVETNLGNYPIMKATLKPPYNDGLAILDSKLVEWGTSTLEVQFGYIFGTANIAVQSPVWRGVLLQPNIDIGADITITLNAQGIGAFTLERHERGQVINGESRITIIKKLLALQNESNSNKENIQLNAKSEKKVLADKISGPLLKKKICFVQGYRTDLQALWDLVREAQCWMTFEGFEMILIARGSLGDEPKLDLALFGASGSQNAPPGTLGPQVRTFPILNASSPTMAVYLPASSLGFKFEGISSRKTEIEKKLLQAQQVATGADQDKSDRSRAMAKSGTPFAGADINSPNAEDQVRQELERSRTSMGIRLEIDTLGAPDILPGDVVHISGLGSRLTGNYGVFNVVHVYGLGGYTTSLTLVSNTSPLFLSSSKQAAEKNQLSVPAATRPSSVIVEPLVEPGLGTLA